MISIGRVKPLAAIKTAVQSFDGDNKDEPGTDLALISRDQGK
jgi:hypothetical protein